MKKLLALTVLTLFTANFSLTAVGAPPPWYQRWREYIFGKPSNKNLKDSLRAQFGDTQQYYASQGGYSGSPPSYKVNQAIVAMQKNIPLTPANVETIRAIVNKLTNLNNKFRGAVSDPQIIIATDNARLMDETVTKLLFNANINIGVIETVYGLVNFVDAILDPTVFNERAPQANDIVNALNNILSQVPLNEKTLKAVLVIVNHPDLPLVIKGQKIGQLLSPPTIEAGAKAEEEPTATFPPAVPSPSAPAVSSATPPDFAKISKVTTMRDIILGLVNKFSKEINPRSFQQNALAIKKFFDKNFKKPKQNRTTRERFLNRVSPP
jgi:hypothetical protein